MADILEVDLPTHAHDDQRQLVIKVKALRGKLWRPFQLDQRKGRFITENQHAENDGFAGESHFRMVVLGARIRDQIVEPTEAQIHCAIHNLFSSRYCQHSYDCCGCISSSAWGYRVSKREWKVTIMHNRNM